MEWTIWLYIPNQDYWTSWNGMALDGISDAAAWALARKLHRDHGHEVVLQAGPFTEPFGEIAKEWMRNPPERPPIEIRRSGPGSPHVKRMAFSESK